MSSVEDLREFLGKTIRVVLSDGRIIEGNLLSMDKDTNFVVGSAIEWHGVEDASSASIGDAVNRNIGSATIPGSHVVQVLAQSS
mmetsp:Transcript_365/g.633  ORF Transcript_365/g.633 Transcript_365/m.633 type:complete len:84 (+) Transcript_365:67-318(+)